MFVPRGEEVDGSLTPRTAQDLTDGYLAFRASTYLGRASATPVGGCLPNQASRSFFFWSVLGGYLGLSISDTGILGSSGEAGGAGLY